MKWYMNLIVFRRIDMVGLLLNPNYNLLMYGSFSMDKAYIDF